MRNKKKSSNSAVILKAAPWPMNGVLQALVTSHDKLYSDILSCQLDKTWLQSISGDTNTELELTDLTKLWNIFSADVQS